MALKGKDAFITGVGRLLAQHMGVTITEDNEEQFAVCWNSQDVCLRCLEALLECASRPLAVIVETQPKAGYALKEVIKAEIDRIGKEPLTQAECEAVAERAGGDYDLFFT